MIDMRLPAILLYGKKEHLNHQIHLPGEENQVKQNQAQFVRRIYLNNKLIFTTSFAVFNKWQQSLFNTALRSNSGQRINCPQKLKNVSFTVL